MLIGARQFCQYSLVNLDFRMLSSMMSNFDFKFGQNDVTVISEISEVLRPSSN